MVIEHTKQLLVVAINKLVWCLCAYFEFQTKILWNAMFPSSYIHANHVCFADFVYDRNQANVLEVNKTDYETCNSDHPLQNWTRGAGRDVVPLNVTKTYYIISGKGFCFSGMKIAVHVEKLPPPPKAAPIKSGAPTLFSTGHILLTPAIFAVGAAWDAFIHFW